jgi:hypothetical protein
MDCGNLRAVAEAIRQRFPKRQIILAADNDKSGAGLESANRAAQAARGKVAMPPNVSDDFSDLLLAEGPQAVETIIRNTATSPGEDDKPDGTTDSATPIKSILDPVNPMLIAQELVASVFTQPDGLRKFRTPDIAGFFG